MHRRITPHPVASLAPSWVLLLSWVLPVIFFHCFIFSCGFPRVAFFRLCSGGEHSLLIFNLFLTQCVIIPHTVGLRFWQLRVFECMCVYSSGFEWAGAMRVYTCTHVCICVCCLCTSICGKGRNDCFCPLSSWANTTVKCLSTQITAQADKAAFHVGSNPWRQTLSHTLTHFSVILTPLPSLIVWASILWDDTSKPV